MRDKVHTREEWETNTKSRNSSSNIALLMFCVHRQGQWKENGFSPKSDSPT